jgi:hypothetical protein
VVQNAAELQIEDFAACSICQRWERLGSEIGDDYQLRCAADLHWSIFSAFREPRPTK